MTTAPRGRSLARSLPVERDSILDGLFQRLVELPLRELLCFCRISTVYQPFCRQKNETECAISFSLNVQYKPFLVKVQLHCRHFRGRV